MNEKQAEQLISELRRIADELHAIRMAAEAATRKMR